MKQLLALLLLGCAVAVHGQAGDPCTQGVAAVELYMHYRGCSGPHPQQRLAELMEPLENNLTKHNLGVLFANYCSSVFPSLLSCFEGNIDNCSSADSLKSVARQTGFICEPNTNRTNPVINHMLGRLSDSDMVANASCSHSFNITMHKLCFRRAMTAIGANPDNFIEHVQNLTMEQLTPKLQLYVRTVMECIVSEVRQNLNSCPQWRGRALMAIQMYVLPTVLGNKNTFTNDQIDALFHWGSHSDTKSETKRDLGQLFKFFKRGLE